MEMVRNKIKGRNTLKAEGRAWTRKENVRGIILVIRFFFKRCFLFDETMKQSSKNHCR